jgi:hypothetical protein
MYNKKQRNREDINFESVASAISPHWAPPMPNCMAVDQSRSSLSRLSPHLSDTEADIADGFAAEALFQFSQDFGLGDLFEFVVQGWLKHPNVEDSVA